MSLAPGEVFAGFIIERELGSGGMGVVYLARHPRLPRHVALKLLRTDLGSDQSFVGRFRREAETVARLDHPNIVSIDDSGAENGQLWLSMRFIDGTTAGEALGAYSAGMPPERAVHIIEKVAAALDFAHRHRVVHRDVKPANILLTQDQDDQDERVFLTDFGVAKAMDEIEAQATALTTAGGVVATLDYAAPEQIEGKPLDGRCDVYALGCVLYKLLTGAIPYPGETLGAKVYARMQDAPVPTNVVGSLPSEFDQVIATALARDPDDRYQTCKALAVAAKAALTSAPRGLTSTVRMPPRDPGATQSVPPHNNSPHNNSPHPAPPSAAPPHAAPPHLAPSHPAPSRTNPAPSNPARSNPGHTNPPHPGPPPGFAATRPGNTGPPSGPSGYSSPDSLPPELAALLGPGMRPPSRLVAPVGTTPRRPARRRSLLAVGVVILVAIVVVAAVIGVGLIHRGQVAGSANVLDRAASASTTPAETHQSTSAGSTTPTSPSTPSTPKTSPAALPPVAGLPHSTPLPVGTLVVSRLYGKSYALYPIDTTTGKVGRAISPVSPHPQNPLLSRQRGSVIYLQGDTTGGTIRTVAADGSGDRLLFPRPAGCSSVSRPAWDQADNQLLAINCGINGGPITLQMVDLQGAVHTTLPTGLAIVDDLSISPDGTKVLYWGSSNRKAGDGGLYLQAIDGRSAPVSITPANGHDADCDFSPDGRLITFRRVVTDSTGTHVRIAIVDASGAAPATVLSAVGQGPVWSPDGKQIAYKGDVALPGGKTKPEVWVLTVAAPDHPLAMADGDSGSITGSPIWGPR